MAMTLRMGILFGLILLSGCASISRQDLGIRMEQEKGPFCSSPQLPTYENGKYDRETGANDYLRYAMAALNAYRDDDGNGVAKGFDLHLQDPSWKLQVSNELPGGLAYRYYVRENGSTLDVLVAFRGTEITDGDDWWANFSWFTRLFGAKDEYDYARQEFTKIRNSIIERANGRTLRFVTTGHSLGGGLAQHIAYAYPCTSAVIFNSSPVVNRGRLREPYENVQVVLIYENNDELTRFKRYLLGDNETPLYKHYNMDVTPDNRFGHSMKRLAVGMARLVTDCQRRGDCHVPASDGFARQAYCTSYGTDDKICGR